MPKPINPHASDAHRLACLSLYRALLKQSSKLWKPTEQSGLQSETFNELLRYRFRRDQNLLSPSQIANGLKAGHAGLDLLQACNKGSSSALKNLSSLIEKTLQDAQDTGEWRSALASIQSPPSPQKLPKIAHLRAVRDKAKQVRHTNSKPILERPLPLSEITGGKRRVPYLVAPHGIPFLRYSKPQPISLTRYLRQRFKNYQKKWDQKTALQSAMLLADYEDMWDKIVHEQHGIGIPDPDNEETEGLWKKSIYSRQEEGTWRRELDLVDQQLSRAIREKDRKSAEMGRKMWDVVVKERELAEQENEQRKEEKAAAKAQQQTQVSPAYLAGELVNHVEVEDTTSSPTYAKLASNPSEITGHDARLRSQPTDQVLDNYVFDK